MKEKIYSPPPPPLPQFFLKNSKIQPNSPTLPLPFKKKGEGGIQLCFSFFKLRKY